MPGTGRPLRPAAALGLAAAGVAAALLLAEAAARLLVPAPNPSAVEAIFAATDAPGVNYVMIPGHSGWAFNAALHTNRLGFRGPDWSTEPLRGRLRIALLGDSHAFGFGVDDEDAVGEQLARRLDASGDGPVEVLNFAVNGYNSVQELGVLRAFALPHRPDVVILVPSPNDADKASFADPEHYLVSSPVAPGSRTAEQEARLAAWRRRTYDTGERSRLLTALARAREQFLSVRSAPRPDRRPPWMGPLESLPEGPVRQEWIDGVMEPVREMIRLSRATGARVLLAPFAGNDEWRRLFRRLAREEEVPLVELLGAFPETRSWEDLVARFGLGWNPHLGPEAHRRWSVLLADRLRSLHWVGPGAGDRRDR